LEQAWGITSSPLERFAMQSHEELFLLARNLKEAAQRADADEFMKPLDAVERAVDDVSRAFSGSWLGYHSRVYYECLRPPPPGARFSQEWGLMDTSFTGLGSHGDWQEFQPNFVTAHINYLAGDPDLTAAKAIAEQAAVMFASAKGDFQSITQGEFSDRPDKYLEKLRQEVDELKLFSPADVVKHLSPRGHTIIRDTTAVNQGSVIPPHIVPLAEIISLRHSIGISRGLADKITKAASHLERQNRRQNVAERVGTNVSIGHGRSLIWRELKDFVRERLGLPWDEFNRVPIAGVTNIARLAEMLDASAIAFVVMTAEDEMADGAMQARMNVVHEAGLFQGRLGFTKAIVLVEDGCTEFSNIQGLGQLRFPKGNIAAIFEDVRRVLEREGLIEG
jgi:hypothetical protein